MEEIRRYLNDKLSAMLPSPIGELIDVQVVALSQPNTAILSDDQRLVAERLRTISNTSPITLSRGLEDLERRVRNLLYGQSEAGSRTDLLHFARLQAIRDEVDQAAHRCRVILSEALSKAGSNLNFEVSAQVISSISEGFIGFQKSFRANHQAMVEALQSIQTAFVDEMGPPSRGREE